MTRLRRASSLVRLVCLGALVVGCGQAIDNEGTSSSTTQALAGTPIAFTEVTRLTNADVPKDVDVNGAVEVVADQEALDAAWETWAPLRVPPVAVPTLEPGHQALLIWGGQLTSGLRVDGISADGSSITVGVTLDRPATGCGSQASVSGPIVVLSVQTKATSATLNPTVHAVTC